MAAFRDGHSVFIYENNGGFAPTKPITVSTNATHVQSIDCSADLVGNDGSKDCVIFRGAGINRGPEVLIFVSTPGEPLSSMFKTAPLEISVCEAKNGGGRRLAKPKTVAGNVQLRDMDNDGRVDLVVAAQECDTVAWYKQESDGSVSET